MSFQHPAQTRTGNQVSTPGLLTALAPPSFPSRPGTSILIDCVSEGSLTVDDSGRRWTGRDIRSRYRRQLITFDMIPDDVLLEIFDFYADEDVGSFRKSGIEEWITLAHVCQRWRGVVFQSPHRLNLRLLCTPLTPAKHTLDIWPPFPLVVHCAGEFIDDEPSGVDNVIAALEHNDRVCQIDLDGLTSSQMGYLTDSTAMQKPFPELTDLRLAPDMFMSDELGPILPDSFLGGLGTAPRLRSLDLFNVPYPRSQKLPTHLVKLELDNIPRSGYIPPEVMAIGLSALTNLELLCLRFRYPPPRPVSASRRPPPPPLTRSILSSLTTILFKGASEYLEEILARIDAPRLDELHITFFNQIIFDTPQLFQFISRTPTLRALEKGYIAFNSKATIEFRSQTSDHDVLSMQIPCATSEWQLSSLEQVCTSSLPLLSTLEDLYIHNLLSWSLGWQDDVENTLWLDLLRSFVAVKNLYLSKDFVPRIAPALQELAGGRTTWVLSTLENIFLEEFQPSEPLHKGIEMFIAARQLTSHPVAVSRWDGDL